MTFTQSAIYRIPRNLIEVRGLYLPAGEYDGYVEVMVSTLGGREQMQLGRAILKIPPALMDIIDRGDPLSARRTFDPDITRYVNRGEVAVSYPAGSRFQG